MKISFIPHKSPLPKTDLIVLPYWEGGERASDFSRPEAERVVASGHFTGKCGEVVRTYSQEGENLLLVGWGKKGSESEEGLRNAYATVCREAMAKKSRSLSLIVPSSGEKLSFPVLLRAMCEGIFLTNYTFDRWKKEKTPLIEELVLSGVENKWEEELHNWQVIASGVHWVRDLVNGNADEINPAFLEKEALSLAKEGVLETRVFRKKELEEEGMGLLLAVGQGAVEEPRLLMVSYKGDPQSQEKTVLVGKGITFDTGGLSLKSTDNMLTMKCDMAGAATVLGVMRTLAALGWKKNVIALAPLAENAIGSRSYKLGDVFRACNGKTVEVLNTDAEGRLILADALSYAVKALQPTMLIDIGTLTGAISVALGDEIAGLFASDDLLAKKLEEASKRTDEKLWRLPLHDYRENLKSEIADLTNVGGGKGAGSMKCALFLQEFVGSVPWAHLDIAGVAYLAKACNYYPARATGWGLRLLVNFLMAK
ncbi:MAG: leucyl aminopeptidase [Verrucomicrobiota bacterium]|nr:leucyl aminopeptidase [Verrucomicrobiota bacterium]